MNYTFEEQKLIEKAIKFLVTSINQSNKNPKPVLIHSIRVGMRLYNNSLNVEVVIAGFLHDLLEDSNVTYLDIMSNFGQKVADLVSANSFNNEIENYEECYKELFKRVIEAGFDATVIKAVDLLDNADYYLFDNDNKARLVNKFSCFIKVSKNILKESFLWIELVQKNKILINAKVQ